MRKSRAIPIKGKPKCAILVDGETETWYFNMLKRNERSIPVDLKPELPQKKCIKEQYEKVLALSKDYDKVYWVVDLDVVLKNSREVAAGKISDLQLLKGYKAKLESDKKKKIEVVINNPCLEYWFLLHFEYTNRVFNNCGEAERLLKRHMPNYGKTQVYFTKTNSDIYLQLRPHLATAIANAKRLPAFDIDNPTPGMTQLHKIFEVCGIGQEPQVIAE